MSKSKGQVLIVDDEIYIQEILKVTLEDAGFECVTVSNAEAALSVLATQSFDLAFTDIRMPGKQGTELLQDIKSAYPNVVVLIITALDSASMAIHSMHLGAYDYIVKPFNLDQVVLSANRALDKRRLENANREYQRYLVQMADERGAETRRLF
jgi:putative two-component system response regulator